MRKEVQQISKPQAIKSDNQGPKQVVKEKEKMASEQGLNRPHQQHNHQYDQIYQQPTKVMRNSNSHYASIMQKFYNSQQQIVDSRTYIKVNKNAREFRHQIYYIKNPQKSAQFIAYCIITKESNSGMVSHQRLLVLDSLAKELKYYSHIPQIPIQTIQELLEEPKETINLKTVQKFQLLVTRRGIGEIELSWLEKHQIKQWKIKMANNSMARQFAALIEEVRTGKHVDNKQKPKSSLKTSTVSPQNKFLQTISQTSNIKKSQVSPSQKNNNTLANMILMSMIQPQSAQHNPVLDKSIKTQKNAANTAIKVQQEQEKVKSNIQDLAFTQSKKITNQKYSIQKASKEKIIIADAITSNNENNTKNESNIQQILIQTQQKKEKSVKQPSNQNKLLSSKKNLDKQQHAQSIKSIKLEQIIKDASIQHMEYSNKGNQLNIPTLPHNPNNLEHHRLSQLEKMVNKRKELDSSLHPSAKKLHIHKQEMELSKIMVKNISRKSSKQSSEKSIKNVEVTPEGVNSKSNNNRQHTLTHHRQNLLDERKYAQTLYDSRNTQKTPKVVNQHSHPRKERARSKSLTKQIGTIIQKKNQKQWLFKWLTASTQLEKGQIYKKFLAKCIEKVKSLQNKFENWYLFHKAGQEYIIRQQEIQFTYMLFEPEQHFNGFREQEMLQKMDDFEYLWDCTNQIDYQNGEIKIYVPLVCVVTYQSLKVFCKVDIQASKLDLQLLSDLNPYQVTINKLSKIARLYLKNAQFYLINLYNKQYLYTNQAQIKPYLLSSHKISLNYNYLKIYVEGIVSLEIHLQQITDHIMETKVPQIIAFLEQFQPLSCLELQEYLHSQGVDCSILPILYDQTVNLGCKKANRLIISQVCADQMAEDVRRAMHFLLLSKNTNKNMNEQIHSIIANTLRLDNNKICEQLLIFKRVSIDLQQLKEVLIDEYVISSMLIKLGIRCVVKTKQKLEEVQNLTSYFWRQFQFTQQSIEFTFEPIAQLFNSKHFNPNYKYLSDYALEKPLSKIKASNRNTEILISKLNTPSGKQYYESTSFQLLSPCQKQKINSLFAQFTSPLDQNHQPLWSQEQNSPFFHLFHFTTSYYYNYQSFFQTSMGIKQLIKKKQYKLADQLLKDQLFRAWIWGRGNPLLLMEIQDLKSLLSVFLSKEIDCLSSCLLSLQIGIKWYEEGLMEADKLLEKSYKAATIHTNYGRWQQAIELFSTCEQLFEKSIGFSQRINPIYQNYLSIYNLKAELYLKTGFYQTAEHYISSNMTKFFAFKKHFQKSIPQILSLVFEEQFVGYSLLFRVYQLQGKKIQMIQLMEDCSVKYIENYIQIMLKKNEKLNADDINPNSKRYFKEIIKNIWIAVTSSCNQWRISTYQHYFNHYYAPLRSIELSVIRDIIIEIRRVQKRDYTMDFEESINFCFNFIAVNLKKHLQNKDSNLKAKPKSIFVVAVIDCLSILSDTDRKKVNKGAVKSDEIQLFQSIVSCLGYEFAVGSIDAYINCFNTWL